MQSSVYTIRNRGESQPRDRRRSDSPEISEAGQALRMRQVAQYGVGRLLLTKREAKRSPAELRNPVVYARNELAAKNRSGTAIGLAHLMLQYENPVDFAERVLAQREASSKSGYLTLRGERMLIDQARKKIAATFLKQATDEASRVDEQMRLEDQQLRAEEVAVREELGWHEDVSAEEWQEECDDIIIKLQPSGAFATTGQSRNGFGFSSNMFFEETQVGLRVNPADSAVEAEIQNDLDRINEAYDEHGLIFGSFRELRMGGEHGVSLFVPLVNMITVEDMDNIRLIDPPVTTVQFQALGIHKIQ